MKVTKRNGNMVIYDDQKNIKSILKANAEVACETISEKEAAEMLTSDEIFISIDLHQGETSAKAWGCDLTYDYVKINGDYRT